MKLIKILLVFCALLVYALLGFFAGVRLTVENLSGQQIHDVKIKYEGGAFSAGNIPDKEIQKKFLGHLGEGSTFDVVWRENSGRICQAQFEVYFHGLTGYLSVRIEILPNGEAILYQAKKIYKPDLQRDSST